MTTLPTGPLPAIHPMMPILGLPPGDLEFQRQRGRTQMARTITFQGMQRKQRDRENVINQMVRSSFGYDPGSGSGSI